MNARTTPAALWIVIAMALMSALAACALVVGTVLALALAPDAGAGAAQGADEAQGDDATAQFAVMGDVGAVSALTSEPTLVILDPELASPAP
jgi:hypothetical protein